MVCPGKDFGSPPIIKVCLIAFRLNHLKRSVAHEAVAGMEINLAVFRPNLKGGGQWLQVLVIHPVVKHRFRHLPIHLEGGIQDDVAAP